MHASDEPFSLASALFFSIRFALQAVRLVWLLQWSLFELLGLFSHPIKKRIQRSLLKQYLIN